MKEVISIKYGWNTIAWAKIMHAWCQNSYQLQKIFHFRGTKTDMGKLFGIWDFLPEKSRLYRYYQNKNQLGFTSSSYINITMKLLIKSENCPKSKVKMKFYIFGKLYLSFASDKLFIFSGFIVLQGMMQIN